MAADEAARAAYQRSSHINYSSKSGHDVRVKRRNGKRFAPISSRVAGRGRSAKVAKPKGWKMRQARPSPSSCPRLLGEVVEQQPQASSPNIMQADEQVISRAGASSDEVRGSALELSSLRRRGRRATASL